MRGDFVFSSESVTPGHPDKLCDQVSDAVIDSYLKEEPESRVTAESAVARGIMFLAIRFASSARVDVTTVAREVIARAGYEAGDFEAQSCSIMTSMTPENGRVRAGAAFDDMVAEHNATLFGYACRQSPGFLPLPIWLAHRLARALADARSAARLPYLAPDGLAQVAVEYRGRRPYRIHSVTVQAATDNGAVTSLDQLRSDIGKLVLSAAFEDEAIVPDDRTGIHVNPRGLVPVGGPTTHAGLTGRKTAIDTYGEYARHSGSALSGKDPARIDRVGAYAARHAAKNVVAAELATECEVQLSYAIGQARPVSMQIDTFDTGRIPDEDIARRIRDCFDFRPAAILEAFDLKRQAAMANGPFFERLAVYGQVGRLDMALPWEQTDKVAALAGA